MKKKIISICLIGMMCSTSVGAATIDNIVPDEQGRVIISGTVEKNGVFTVQMLNPGVKIDDINDENVMEKVHAVGEFEPDKTGSFKKILTMQKNAEDKQVYTIRINGENENCEKTFTYYSVEILNSEFAKYKTSKTAAEAYTVIKNVNNGVGNEERFGINTPNYMRLSSSSREKVCNNAFLSISKIKELADLRNEIEKQAIAEGISMGSSAVEKLDKYADNLGILSDKRYEIYCKMSGEEKIQVAKRLENADLTTEEKARKAFAEAVFLTELKNAQGMSAVKELIGNNEDLFGENALDKYNSINDTSTADKALAGGDFKTIKEVENKINDTLKTTSDGTGSSNSSSGGGSSSGGSGSVMPGMGVTIPTQNSSNIVFKDLAGAEWARASIEYLAGKGVINGRSNNEFYPNSNVKREEFVKMLVLAFGIDTNGKKSDFSDISKDNWCYPYVSAAVELGLVQGNGKNTFGIGQIITRQDMAVLVWRFTKHSGATLPSSAITEFTDKGTISQYAIEAVSALRAADIVSGMPGGEFKPFDPCTRAQAAKIIYTALSRTGRI